MIPVLGVPVLVRPDLLWEMLDSVDVPVTTTYVIDNGGVVDAMEAYRREVDVYTPAKNLGVAASWNRIIADTPDAPWWLITGFDVTFAPGDLARLAHHMATVGGLAMLGSFSIFGIDRMAVERAGTFDENYHPAYYEDNDFDYRCRLTGVPIVALPFGGSHKISSTLESNAHYRARNNMTFPANQEYFHNKWGGSPYREKYTSPFDRGGDPRDWTLDPDRLVRLSWER